MTRRIRGRETVNKETFVRKAAYQEKSLILCGPYSQPLFALTQAGFLDKLGQENVCGDVENSLVRARQILDQKKNKKKVDGRPMHA
jgi:hypothetical protein